MFYYVKERNNHIISLFFFRMANKRVLSLNLSEVLSDIGVNEDMIIKVRRSQLLNETLITTAERLRGNPISAYTFGSRSEGSTTYELKSDLDCLICYYDINVIQDWSEWEQGKINLLMIKEETTSAGYCLLQILDRNEPRPACSSLSHHFPVDSIKTKDGRMLLANNIKPYDAQLPIPNDGNDGAKHLEYVINGPAQTHVGPSNESDSIAAFCCKSWPVEAKAWLLRRETGPWPTREMKRLCEGTGCFVVPVSSKIGASQELEWRISTCHAERYLMLSLNITQIKCYVLMKMLLKVFIKPKCYNVLSSFMCKNVLLMCIQDTQSNVWQEHNLFECLNSCLLKLQSCVMNNNCPHFIIPGNNLMAGKISPSNKRKILEVLQIIIQSDGGFLYDIPTDSLGARLFVNMNSLRGYVLQICPQLEYMNIVHTANLILFSALHAQIGTNIILLKTQGDSRKLAEYLLTLARWYHQSNVSCFEKSAYTLLALPLCATLASLMASRDICSHNELSPLSLSLFSVGVNSDASSGRLKLASAFYCAGEFVKAESVLRQIQASYNVDIVDSMCVCIRTKRHYSKQQDLLSVTSQINEGGIQHAISFCVKFLRGEMYCAPKELQYEMFRSTKIEMRGRKELFYDWMEWAVVDSQPYLYFLQYKTYAVLLKDKEKHQALTNLSTSIEKVSNLCHKETALNLLGQCLEKERRFKEALKCYSRSLNERAINNVARIHICRVLNILINKQVL